MFLRLPQSFRIARITASSPIIHRSIQLSTRPLIPPILSQPELLSVNNVVPTSSKNCTVTASAEREPPVLVSQQGQVAEADAEQLAPIIISIRALEAALENAFAQNQYDTANSVIEKLVGLYRSNNPARFVVFHRLLHLDDVDKLCDTAVLEVLLLLRSFPDEANMVAPQTLHRILRRKGHHQAIHGALGDILILQLQNVTIPSGLASIQYQPPALIRELFSILQDLVVVNPEFAFNIFSTLVEKRFVPPESMEDLALLESGDPQLVMLASLAKASLHWEWSSLATGFIQTLLQIESAAHPLVPGLITDVVTSFVDSDIAADSTHVKYCLALIQAMHLRCPAPDSAIRRFYDMAQICECGTEAEDLYFFTRSESVLAIHHYPPPRGYATGWLMQTMFESSRHPHLSQTLAEEVVQKHISLPTHCRPRFIAITVSTGNLSLGVALWERYAVGMDRYAVIGDGALLFALSRACMSLIRQKEAMLNLKMGAAQSLDTKQALRGVKRFLRRAVKEFLKFHKQLDEASPQTLTYYSQACFVLGQFEEGLAILGALIAWKEVPDADVMDFCLGIIGKKDPRTAARLIRDMGRLGAVPSLAACTTLLTQAMTDRLFHLVDQVVALLLTRHLNELEHQHLSLVLDSCIEWRPAESRERHQLRLQAALEDAGQRCVSLPRTGVSLVRASLKLGDPKMACRFWMLLVRDAEDDTLGASVHMELEKHMAQGVGEGAGLLERMYSSK